MQKEVKEHWGQVIHKQDVSAGSETKEELSDGMDQSLESLWHGPSLLDDWELKYDGHSNKCG